MHKTTGTACTPYKFAEVGTKLDTKGKAYWGTVSRQNGARAVKTVFERHNCVPARRKIEFSGRRSAEGGGYCVVYKFTGAPQSRVLPNGKNMR